MRVALFDYGVGNLHSLAKVLVQGKAQVVVTSDWDEAIQQDALVLPGVGAFSAAVEALPEDRTELRAALDSGLPTLGICLGMQLLFDHSEEGIGDGIGIIPGRVRRIQASVVPQMGWNEIEISDDPIFNGLTRLDAYYANSFVCEPDDAAHAIGWSRYEDDRFACVVRRGSVWGAQFHPEELGARPSDDPQLSVDCSCGHAGACERGWGVVRERGGELPTDADMESRANAEGQSRADADMKPRANADGESRATDTEARTVRESPAPNPVADGGAS